MKKYLLLLTLVCLLSFVSAGIQTINNTGNVTISKVVDKDVYANITIQNTEAFSFYNVTFATNPYISMPSISNLSAGQIVSVLARVFTNEDISKSLKIQGYYYNNVGLSNRTYNINVNWAEGPDSNPTSAIIGDSILFNNTEPGKTLYLNILSTGQLIQIPPLTSQTISNLVAGEYLEYKLYYFSDVFQYNGRVFVNSAQDYLHRDEFDAAVTLKVTNTFTPTNITASFLGQDNLTINFYSQQDGFFALTNIGNNTAVKVKIVGDWFGFSSPGKDLSNLNIEAGQTVNILYNIKPAIYSTNQTNQTYTKTIEITGNFPTITHSFSVYVPYAVINSIGNTTTQQGLIEFITMFCNANPTVCNTQPQIIYRDNNSSDSYFNATLGQKQLRELFMLWIDYMDKTNQTDNYFKEKFNEYSTLLNQMTISNQNTTATVSSIRDEMTNSNGIWTFFGIIFATLIICGLIVTVGLFYRRRNKMKRLGEYG